jgi:sorting nexin-29
MKDNRAPGEDAITAELIKKGGKSLWENIHRLIVSIWNKGEIPEEWRTAFICPIYKKGSKVECKYYRGISLLNVTYEIFTNILSKYLKVYTDEIIGEYQGGFRKGQSTTENIFTLRQVLEKAHEYNISLHQLHIDFKQAFDRIDRIQIIEMMKEFGIPLKLVKITKMTLFRTYNRVKIQNKLSGRFSRECGVRQGDSLSTLLFNIGLEKVIRNIEINPGGTNFNRTRKYMAYADDIVVIRRSVEVHMQIQSAASAIGLEININKTKYMRTKKGNEVVKSDITLNGETFEEVDNFKYLGALITSQNEVEANKNISALNRCYRPLRKILVTRYISKNTEVRMYKTITERAFYKFCGSLPLGQHRLYREVDQPLRTDKTRKYGA